MQTENQATLLNQQRQAKFELQRRVVACTESLNFQLNALREIMAKEKQQFHIHYNKLNSKLVEMVRERIELQGRCNNLEQELARQHSIQSQYDQIYGENLAKDRSIRNHDGRNHDGDQDLPKFSPSRLMKLFVEIDSLQVQYKELENKSQERDSQITEAIRDIQDECNRLRVEKDKVEEHYFDEIEKARNLQKLFDNSIVQSTEKEKSMALMGLSMEVESLHTKNMVLQEEKVESDSGHEEMAMTFTDELTGTQTTFDHLQVETNTGIDREVKSERPRQQTQGYTSSQTQLTRPRVTRSALPLTSRLRFHNTTYSLFPR
jgi:hypothetical protein